jgi:hypothetical protein
MTHSIRTLLAAGALVWLSTTVGCGAETQDGSVTRGAAALSSGQSFLVSFHGGSIPANADALVASAGGTIVARYATLGVVLARSSGASFAPTLRGTGGIDAVGNVSAAHSAIEQVGVNGGSKPPQNGPSGAGDPLSFRQWDMDQIHVPQAQAITTGSSNVLVGFLDSGVDITHPDLAGQVNTAASVSCLNGIPDPSQAVWANDIIGHGTFTSGTVVAPKNGVGTIGVAPGVKVAMVKVAVDDINDVNFGLVFPDAVICGIDWGLSHGFDLFNASLTIDPFTGPVDDIFCTNDPDRLAVIQIVRGAIAVAAKQKVSLVAAAGNFIGDLANLPGSQPGVKCNVLPVQTPKVIGVSAVGVTKLLAFYSDYGAGAIDVTGPGGDGNIPDPLVTDTGASGQVLGPLPGDSLFFQGAGGYMGQVLDCSVTPCATYAYLQGTSAAAPHVVGIAALIISRSGRMQPDALAARLRNTATPLACPPNPYNPPGIPAPATCTGQPNNTNFYGAGEVDALAALK